MEENRVRGTTHSLRRTSICIPEPPATHSRHQHLHHQPHPKPQTVPSGSTPLPPGGLMCVPHPPGILSSVLCPPLVLLSRTSSPPSPDAQSPQYATSNLTQASSRAHPAPSSRSYAPCRQGGWGDFSVPLTTAPGQPPAPGFLRICHSEVREGAQEQGLPWHSRGHTWALACASPCPPDPLGPSRAVPGLRWGGPSAELTQGHAAGTGGAGVWIWTCPRSAQKGKGKERSSAVPGDSLEATGRAFAVHGTGVPSSRSSFPGLLYTFLLV